MGSSLIFPAIWETAIQEPSASSIGPCAIRDRESAARRDRCFQPFLDIPEVQFVVVEI
jgi:hypothetical protein